MATPNAVLAAPCAPLTVLDVSGATGETVTDADAHPEDAPFHARCNYIASGREILNVTFVEHGSLEP